MFLYVAGVWAFAKDWWVFLVAPMGGALLAGGSTQTVNYMLEGRARKRLRSVFKRYVSDQVIEQVLKSPDQLALSGERKRISVLFSDIRNFTTRSESVPAEQVVTYLNEYFTAMVRAIHKHKGTVDKFMGDGIMAIFGAPLEDPQSASNAVRAALEMQSELDSLNQVLKSRGIAPIRIGVGIHTGEAVVGNIGSPQKMEYTAIGDVVNTSSRLEGLNKKYDSEILISEDTYSQLDGEVSVKHLGEEMMKGKKKAVSIYRVLPEAGL